MLFDFLDCVADLKGKEIKRAALNELVESVATSRGVLIEPLYPEAIKMVGGEERGGQGLGRQLKDKWLNDLSIQMPKNKKLNTDSDKQ